MDINQKHKDNIVQEQVEKKEIKKLFSQLKRPGHILWEFQPLTGKLGRVEIKHKSSDLNGRVRSKVEYKDDCLYFQALNRENAIKRIRKSGYEHEINS